MLLNKFSKSFYLLLVMYLSYLLGWYLFEIISKLSTPIPDVADTVGYTSFMGGALKTAEIYAFNFSFLSIGIFIIISAIFWNKIKKRLQLKCEEKDLNDSANFSYQFVSILLLLYASLTFPDISNILNFASNLIHSSHFDSQHFNTWEYFRHNGLIPFKDFWFPYGAFFYTISTYPPDIFYLWVHSLILFSVCVISIYKFLNYSKLRLLFILFIMFWLFSAGIIQLLERYFLSVSLLLIFVLCLNTKKMFPFIFMGFYFFYIFFWEPSQIIYAIPACLLVLFTQIFYYKSLNKNNFFSRNLIISILIFLVLIFVYFIYLHKTDSLSEYLLFYKNLGNLSKYSMAFYGMKTFFSVTTRGNLLLFLTFSCVILSIWNFFTNPQKKTNDFLNLGLTLLVLLMFQKMMIRPFLISQIIGVPAFTLLFMLANLKFNNRITLSHKYKNLLRLVFLSTIFIICFLNYDISKNIKKIFIFPKNLKLAFKDIPNLLKLKSAHFAPKTFDFDGINGEKLKTLLLQKLNFEKEDDLFVLGDNSYLYIILKKITPFYISFYSQSILYQQKNTVSWLKKHKPKYVILDNTFKEFDYVPNIVRVPILFDYIIKNYKFEDSLNKFVILKIKEHEEPIDINRWRDFLGEIVNLGFIPSCSDPYKFFKDKESKNITPYLKITISNPLNKRTNEIQFEIHEKKYTIRFKERKNVKNYYINFNRIWFLQFAEEIKADYVSEEKQNMEISLIHIPLSKEILY